MTKLQTILIPIALAVLMVAGCERVVTSTMDPEPAVPEPAVPESEPGLEGSWVQERSRGSMTARCSAWRGPC